MVLNTCTYRIYYIKIMLYILELIVTHNSREVPTKDDVEPNL